MKEQIKNRIRFHSLAIIASIAVALAASSFFFFLDRFADEAEVSYYPVAIRGEFDEVYYAVRASGAYHYGISGETATLEHFGSPLPLPMLNPMIIASLGKVFGSFQAGIVVAQSIFPAIAFFLIYLIAFELTRSRTLAISFALLFLVIPRFGLWPSDGAISLFGDPRRLYFSRIDYPAITFPFFALAVYLFVRLINRREISGGLLFGASVGFLFYTYLYDWVYVGTAIGIGALIALLRKDFWLLKQFAVSIGVAALISLPYLANMLGVVSLPTFSDIELRLGAEFGRTFRWEIVYASYFRVLLFSGLLWFFYQKLNKALPTILTALLLPIIFLLNIQLITGVVPQPDHWHRTTFLAVSLSAFLIVLGVFRSLNYSQIFKRIIPIIAIITFVWILPIQYKAAKESLPSHTLNNSYLKAYSWLKLNTSNVSVIGSISGETNDEIAILNGNPLFTPNGFHTTIATNELWQRFMNISKLLDLSSEDFSDSINSQSTYLFSDEYHSHEFNSYLSGGGRIIPSEIIASKVSEYQRMKRGDPLYSLDYIIIGPREKTLGAKTPLAPFSVLVYNDDLVRIYRNNLK